ncbi:MAG TPA: ABC transporter permease [Gemmatimonadaceae bacterium]|nr:ABC transporter permease [Gemmatimonadaceae bacterium]
MPSLVRDLRYAARTLRKTPGFTAVAILALALGIGLTTAMFSVVYGVLIRGLPYPHGDRIAIVYRNNPAQGIRRQSLPIQDFVDYRAQQQSFTALGAYVPGMVNVSGGERAERVAATWVTADVFQILGVQPMLGRAIRRGEDAPSGAHVAVLSYRMWRERYDGDARILGKSIRVDGLPYTVVGVMPKRFAFPDAEQLWLPLQTDPLASTRGQGPHVITIGELKPGATLASAGADVGAIAQRLALAYPTSDTGFEATAGTFTDWSIGPGPRRLLVTMLGAVFCVLLIACANVMNLLLGRAMHRTREVGIRTALGASRMAIIRQFLAEALVLSVASVAIGVSLAYVGMVAFHRATVNTNFPSFVQIGLHLQVLAFAAAVGVVATLVSGMIPAVQSSRTDVSEVLKDASRGVSGLHIGRLSKGLVMFETALSCALLVAAGLMIESVAKMRTMDPGFATTNVFTAGVAFPDVTTDTARQVAAFQQLTNTLAVSPGFFATLDIASSQGRVFTSADRARTLPVAVVTQRFVKRFLQHGDPIGQRIRLDPSRRGSPWLTIVGVVPDIFGGDPEDPRPPIVFQPFAQAPTSAVYIAARTAGDPMALTRSVRDVVSAVDPDLPMYWPMSLADAIAQPLWFVRVFGTMFMVFGLIALFLATVGLYAVMSFSVSRRTREMGIRMALGAQRRNVVRLILGQGVLQLMVGMLAGLALAAAIVQLLSAILFDVQPRDPVVFGGVVIALMVSGVLACVVPAVRATRTNPLTALREE